MSDLLTARTIPLRRCPFCGGDAWMGSRNCILYDTDISDLTVFEDGLDDFIAAWDRRDDG